MNIMTHSNTYSFQKVITIAVFILYSFLLTAQENSISPLFGISKSSTTFQNDLNAINQQLGKKTLIESFGNTAFFGLNYTISTQATSNVDKLYILKTPSICAVYDLPYFFDPNYSGVQADIALASSISDLDYHQNSGSIFGYSLADQSLISFAQSTGSTLSSKAISFNSSIQDFSLKTTDDFAILAGIENDSTKILFHDIQNNSNETLVLDSLYKSFYTVSNKNLNNIYAVAQDLNDQNWLIELNPAAASATIISALVSCVNCSAENISFNKNALTLDWENEQLIAAISINQDAVESHALLTLSLADGSIANFANLNTATSNLYFNKAASDLVFPGDANHDGIVNTRDLLPIGLRYSYNTSPRFTQNINWVGQQSFNTGVLAQGVDVKHADCNGDGQINDLDILAIKENYSSIHNSTKSATATTADCDFPLAFSFIEIAYEGNDVRVNIKLGESFDPVADVYGVSFSVFYDNSFVVPNTMQTVGMNSWFGNDGANSIHTSQDNFSTGKIDITLTGVDLLNRSGGGDIIQIAWTMEDDVIPIADLSENMILSIEDVYIINLQEDILESCGTNDSLEVTRKNTVGINKVDPNKIKIFPNPASSEIKIFTDEMIQSLELLSITGEQIKELRFGSNKTINVSSLAKGIYVLKLNTSEGVFFEKIIIQ